jgi:hypothetical protein
MEQLVGSTSEPDLISFVSVSTPQNTPQGLQPIEVSRPLLVPTVDDLLSRSPTPPQDGIQKEQTFTLQTQSFVSPDHVNLNVVGDERTAEQSSDVLVQVQDRLSHSPLFHSRQLTPDSQPSSLRRSKRLSISPARSASPPITGDPSIIVAPLRLPLSKTASKSPARADGSPPSTVQHAANSDRDGLQITDNNERAKKKRKRPDEESRTDRLDPSTTSILRQPISLRRPDPHVYDRITNTPQKPSSLTLPQRLPILPQLNSVSTPVKYRTDPLNRTPARRDLVSNLEGSPWKGPSGTRVFGGTVFRTQALDDPNRSPVRRTLVPDVRRTPHRDIPNVVFSKERDGSVEPRPVFKGRSASVEPVFSRPQNSNNSASKVATSLPFPVIIKPPVIHEEGQDDVPSSAVKPRATSAPPVVSPTSVKSSLKQTTISSRIPRIGVKPYARPAKSDKSKLPVSMYRVRATDALVNSLSMPSFLRD